MPVVRVEPAGIDLAVDRGEAVAEAAWRQGYVWPTVCWGQAECMACLVRVIAGEGEVEPAGEQETSQLGVRLSPRLRDPHVRLACRLKVLGDGVTLEKRGVERPAG